MSESLYRKYRPSSFDDVRGQDHVVSVLEQSIKKGTFGHAYVFAGSRGTGKTSVARIFASALKVSPEDLYEIDAASNTGVDDIRDIRDGVGTMPFSSPYKVYLLDEAHMLSKQAWNALLKTLEEPPKHCIFILATTELDKVPETVLSRCQTFTFKKPMDSLLKETIEDISKSEGFTLEKSASELIAFLADGSFRDAQSILQKILSASNDKKISLKEVELVTGAPRGEILNECIEALEEKSSSRGLEAIDKALKDNIDMKIFIKLLLERIRTVLLLRFAGDLEKEIKDNTSEKDFTFLHSIANKKGSLINSKTLDDLLRAYEETSFAAIKALPLQLVFIRLEEK
jgi:DNA polymerase-3 subunit gamma/tau